MKLRLWAVLFSATCKAFAPTSSRIRNAPSLLHMTPPPNFASTDPFQILGIDPTADSQMIKRAYKKLALKYHPDMATTNESTPEQKRMASDQFAKINAAYEALSGKNARATTTTTTTNNNNNAWTPPHRRTSGPSRTSTTTTTDWREEYIPYSTTDDAKYDTGGDSFGAILSDLFASSASIRGGGVFRDFVEFLEQTVDGYSSSSTTTSTTDMDTDLQFLLQTGTIREIGDEMDETELVLKQLNTKMERNNVELMQRQATVTNKFTEKMELEETMEELRARKRIVENYIQKARKRLLALQTRYKVLVTQGANDPKATGGRRSSRTTRVEDTTSYQSPSSASQQTTTSTNAEDSWKDESFGSFGRGRGSSRRRAQRNAYETTSSTSSGSSSSPNSASSSNNNASYETPSRSSSSFENTSSYVPPHRRTQASTSTQDDKRRLRELKVDEEFEKLKRELGL